MKKQKFLIEVDSENGVLCFDVGNAILNIEGVKYCASHEQCVWKPEGYSQADDRLQSLRAYISADKQVDQIISIKQCGSGHQPFKEIYPKVSTELNKIRRELVIQALEEVLPGHFNKRRYEYDPVGYSKFLACLLKCKNIEIKHFITDAAPAMPSDICCIYQDETPIHFFNYL